jgi:hypothetical protein
VGRMIARFPKQVRRTSPVIVLLLVALFLVVSLLGGYFGGWDWVGVTAHTVPTPESATYQPSKTMWDWLQLLIVPTVLAAAGLWFTRQQNRRQSDLARDKQREDLLATYFDRLSDLLLKGDLRQMPVGRAQRQGPAVARARTLATLSTLDSARKGALIQFLHESGLITGEMPVIQLSAADLSGANLREANLSEADLHEADLRGANLYLANLSMANLSMANLRGVYLGGANLSGAILLGADLSEAILDGTGLRSASYNKRPRKGLDATRWPAGFDPVTAGTLPVDKEE